MHSFVQDLRYAVRVLTRNPGFTATAVLALGLGIGANTAVFTVLNGVLLESLPFPDPGRLFLASNAPMDGPFGPMLGMTESDYLSFRRQNRTFQSIAAFNQNRTRLTGSGEPLRLRSANVTADFFSVLALQPVLGRAFLPEDEPEGHNHVALLSNTLWREHFGADRNIAGKVIKLDGVAHTVIGVMPAGFQFPYEAEVWTPFEVRVDAHNVFFRPVVGRLKPGATPQLAQAELQSIAKPIAARVLPLRELLVGNIQASLVIFAGAVAFVLLIACANVANLFLMRAASRVQETAVRIALGAGRWRIVRQHLTESMAVSMLGGITGIVLAMWGVPGLLALAPKGAIPRLENVHLDARVFVFTFGLSLLTGLLFGAAPAFHAGRRAVRPFLTYSSHGSTGSGVVRNVLAVAEIALALVLLSGAGLMLKSVLRMRAVEPGFRPENALTMTVELPAAVYRSALQIQTFHTRVLEALSHTPQISAAGAINWLPLGGMLTKGDFRLEGGRRLPRGYMVDKLVISPGYFRAMGIRLLSGRDFSERDNSGAPGVAIISRSVAQTLWPGEEAIGKRIAEQEHPKAGDWFTIIGVVDNVRQQNLTARGDALYFPYLQTPVTGWITRMTFVARTTDGPLRAVPVMRAAVHQVDPDQPVEQMASLQDVLAKTTAEKNFQARLLSIFSLVALALAVIGIYAVLAYSVAMRTREIGIRIALGAEAGRVMRMVLGRTLALSAAGLVIGTAGALLATRALTKLLFQVKPYDAATFVSAAVVLAGVSLVAGWIPARRAAHVDPLVALRWE